MATIWIDIDNAPHVQIFKPIYYELKKHGHEVIVTARKHAYSCELLDLAKIPYKKIGRYYGKNKILKVFGTLIRTLQLSLFSRRYKIGLALNHGSRSLILACRLCRIFCVSMFDYEHTNKTIFRLSCKVMVPEIISTYLNECGFSDRMIIPYKGLKEDIYCHDIGFNEGLLRNLGISHDQIMVIIRPPATTAHYHNTESERLFIELLNFLEKQKIQMKVIISPRTPEQRKELAEMNLDKSIFYILDQPVDGLDLLYNSDLIVSGGGTMVREAAVIGIPAYSIFQGEEGRIDKWLEEKGKLVFINTTDDFRKIKLVRKDTSVFNKNSQDNNVLTNVINEIESLLKR